MKAHPKNSRMSGILPTCKAAIFAILLLGTGVARSENERIDSLLWDFSASTGTQNAIKAGDADELSRWDTGVPQTPGQWFQVDMGEARSISSIELDSAKSPGDFPRSYELSISNDGKQWEKVQSGTGGDVTRVTLETPKTFRYLRFTIPEGIPQIGSFWSIHEIKAFGAPSSASHWPEIRWRVIEPTLPTRDIVVAGYSITDFGIDPAKGEDITKAVRVATRMLAKAGGGTLWLPAGKYRLSEPISLSNNVTIRGDWAAPAAGKPIQGTILEMTANRDNANGAPGVSLYKAAAVVGINFWYPEQRAPGVVPYPVTVKQFGGVGMSVENVTFVNSYRGFQCGPEGAALFFLRNVYGTVLETGISIDGTSDIGRMENVRFSPTYWAESGLPNAPAVNIPLRWMLDNGTAISMRRNDWSYAYDVHIDGYKVGFHALPSLEKESIDKGLKNYPNGNNAKFKFQRCRTAIRCENVADVGMMFDDMDISLSDEAIVAEKPFDGVLQIQNSRLAATKLVQMQGKGQILFTGCTLKGLIDNETGYLGFAGCSPAIPPRKGKSPGVGEINVMTTTLPQVTNPYVTPTDRFAPPSSKIAVVTDATYGAKGDAKADDTAAVEKAISEMKEGGGTVFFPPGEYRITKELTVPTGVELRGANEGPHHSETRGSVIDVIPGKGQEDGTPFITLSANSGLRGLTFHYPEQDALNVSPYPWMIRGGGEGVWVINVTCTFAYRILDLATMKCDRHFVDYLGGHALREAFRIGGGSMGGRLINCQLNPHYYSFTTSYENSPPRKNPKDSGSLMDANHLYAKAHADAFVIGDCTDQVLFQNFVFGTRRGLVFTGSAEGASGWCLGHGSDQCQWGVWAEKIGNMPMINSQLVTVESLGENRGYIGLAPEFQGTLKMVGMDSWGQPATAVLIEGGRLELNSAVFATSGKSTVTLRNKGSILLENAVARDPQMLVERAEPGDNVQINGVAITGSHFQAINTPADLADSGLELLKNADTNIGIPFPAGSAIPVKDWSVKPSVNKEAAVFAIDGDESTRWATGRGAQRGDEVVVELDKPRKISKVRVDTVQSPGDFPKRFQLYLSLDGKTWGNPVASGSGEADLRIGFTPQEAKYLRIVNLAAAGSFWSIHEIQVAE